MDESIVNRVENGLTKPFLLDEVEFPANDAERRAILDNADLATGGKIPVIISPSGMLTGGNSPRYLIEFAARYDSAQVILTGYQALNTTGRTLQNQIKAKKEEITVSIDAEPMGTDWPVSENVAWTSTDAGEQLTRATFPADWVTTLGGLSGHAAQHGLLEFARTVSAPTIALIHGPNYAQERLGTHLVKNVERVEEVTRARLLTPIAVSRTAEVETPALTPEMFDTSDMDTFSEQLEHVHELIAALNEEVAAARHSGPNEETIRRIVRDELERLGEPDSSTSENQN